MKMVIQKNALEQRTKPRKPYLGHILFVSKNGLHEGRLVNFSSYGLFIETKACLSEGEIITISLPYIRDKRNKCKGQIVRSNNNGFGIELFRKRRNANFRVIK